MADPFDVVVVGAGAAGVSAALVAAGAGATVAVVDSGPAPGGQYHRPPTASPEWARRVAALRVHVDSGLVDLRHDVTAYAAVRESDGTVAVLLRGDDRHPDAIARITGRTLVIATGAHDRHLPFRGWTLPGVMAGGAAQALVKGSGVLPGQRIVVAGTGPFLFAVAHTILEAGGTIAAVVESNDPLTLGLPARGLTAGLGKSVDLGRFIRSLAAARVPYLRRHRVRAALGGQVLEAVSVTRVDVDWRAVGDEQVIPCDTLAIGYGFTAQTDLATQLGCAMRTGTDGGLAIEVDNDQRTSIPGVYAAGETTGIGGVDLAGYEGLVAGHAASVSLGLAPALRASSLARARARVRDLRRFADALARTFPIRDGWRDDVGDATIVCRCEEVSAARIRTAIDDLGATDARAVKLLTRAGMGWCQGRICATAVDALCPNRGTMQQVAAAHRPLAAPVPLGALASVPDERISP